MVVILGLYMSLLPSLFSTSLLLPLLVELASSMLSSAGVYYWTSINAKSSLWKDLQLLRTLVELLCLEFC
jgi:hypothetical protein